MLAVGRKNPDYREPIEHKRKRSNNISPIPTPKQLRPNTSITSLPDLDYNRISKTYLSKNKQISTKPQTSTNIKSIQQPTHKQVVRETESTSKGLYVAPITMARVQSGNKNKQSSPPNLQQNIQSVQQSDKTSTQSQPLSIVSSTPRLVGGTEEPGYASDISTASTKTARSSRRTIKPVKYTH